VESIVVDGASKDGTVELIEKYSHQFSGRMKWLSEPDKGIYDAMNKGIGMATGDVIGFLNADDYYQDGNVLEAIAEAFARHGTDAVHGNLNYINGAREIVRTWRGTEYTPGSFQRGWNPAHPTFYCKKDCFTRYVVITALQRCKTRWKAFCGKPTRTWKALWWTGPARMEPWN